MRSNEFIELAKCASNPWYFLTTHVHTQDPAKGVANFPDYDYLKKFVEALDSNRYLLVPKSRQVMATWTVVGYFLWRALFKGIGDYVFLSRNERSSDELLERVRFIHDRLPEFLKPKLTTNSKHEIAFGKLGSRIFSLPATAAA